MQDRGSPANFNVPALITSPADVSRLRREVKALDDYMRQQELRAPGSPSAMLPKMSRLLHDLATTNDLNLLDAKTRDELAEFLADVAANAPVLHISFAVDPSSAFLQKIVQWLRQNIHPSILVRVGLQPSIAAGCTVQTTNRYFDFSLRQYLQQHRQLLVDGLTKAAAPAPAAVPEPSPSPQETPA